MRRFLCWVLGHKFVEQRFGFSDKCSRCKMIRFWYERPYIRHDRHD